MSEGVIAHDIFHELFVKFSAVAHISFKVFHTDHVYFGTEVFNVQKGGYQSVPSEDFSDLVCVAG